MKTRNSKRYFLSVLILILIPSVIYFRNKFLHPIISIDTNIDKSYLKCSSDSDCIIIQDGPCPCSEGGRARAINQSKKDDWLNLIKNQFGNRLCPLVITNHPNCIATPKCINNICQLVK